MPWTRAAGLAKSTTTRTCVGSCRSRSNIQGVFQQPIITPQASHQRLRVCCCTKLNNSCCPCSLHDLLLLVDGSYKVSRQHQEVVRSRQQPPTPPLLPTLRNPNVTAAHSPPPSSSAALHAAPPLMASSNPERETHPMLLKTPSAASFKYRQSTSWPQEGVRPTRLQPLQLRLCPFAAGHCRHCCRGCA